MGGCLHQIEVMRLRLLARITLKVKFAAGSPLNLKAAPTHL
jgi:hypothetical protein